MTNAYIQFKLGILPSQWRPATSFLSQINKLLYDFEQLISVCSDPEQENVPYKNGGLLETPKWL